MSADAPARFHRRQADHGQGACSPRLGEPLVHLVVTVDKQEGERTVGSFAIWCQRCQNAIRPKVACSTVDPNRQRCVSNPIKQGGKKRKGQIATASYPRSSKTLRQVDCPAPARPVTTTTGAVELLASPLVGLSTR